MATGIPGIPGYELQTDLRQDRSDTDRGRGGGLLVRGVTFYLIYRSPNSPTDEITRLAGLIRQAEKDCVIIGDFNLPSIWEAATAKNQEPVSE